MVLFHCSSNSTSNPNKCTVTVSNSSNCTEFVAPYPSDSTFLTTGGNADNSGYPALSATAGTYNYPAVGTLEYDITERDLAQAGMPVVDGCPNMYNLVVTSHKRPTDTITIPYNAKGAYDFLEGVYDVAINGPTVQGNYLSESVSIFPGRRNVRALRGSDFWAASTILVMTVKNNTNVVLVINKYGAAMAQTSGIPVGGSQTYNTGACGLMTATASGVTYDTWVMPFGANSTHAIANGANVYVFTITNGGANSKQLLISQDNVTIGTIYLRETIAFNVPKGATVVVKKQDGTSVLATYSNNTGGQTVTW